MPVTATLKQCAVMKWSGVPTGTVRQEAWDGSTFFAKLAATTRQYTTPHLPVGTRSLRIVCYDAAGKHTNLPVATLWIPDSSIPAPVTLPTTRFPRLVFEDTFSGSVIDPAKWSIYDGEGHNGNGLRDPKTWSIIDGMAVCTARWDAAAGVMRAGGMQIYDSYRYGRWEVVARCDEDPTGVTAVNELLLWPQGEGGAVVSTRGEINACESGNGSRSPMNIHQHYGANLQVSHELVGVSGVDWHTVAVEWDAEGVRYYIDDKWVWTVSDPTKQPPAPMNLCIQLDAIANRDCGGPRRLFIDSVRVYQ